MQQTACHGYIYSILPTIDSGAPSAQIFVGTEFAHQYLQNEEGQRDKQFINTLEDNVHKKGAAT